MRFDNGLFAFDIPAGWSADEREDGNLYITSDQADEIWISAESGGVDGEGAPIDPASFVRSAYADKLLLPGAQQTISPDGRIVVRWTETTKHGGKTYALCHGLAAWGESDSNLQLMMFQAAYPETQVSSVCAQVAQAFAWSAPSSLHFYRWRRQRAA